VELHGGRLEIESALGEGTRVTAAFPGARIIRELPPV
jgi:signal transduction histidine kinase